MVSNTRQSKTARRSPWARLQETRLGAKLAPTLPERWTVFADLNTLQAPEATEFAHFGTNSWIVPPGRVVGAGRISIGDIVVLMEESSIVVEPAIGGSEPLLVIGDRAMFGRFATIRCCVGIRIGTDLLTSDSVAIVDNWGPARGDGPPLPPAPIVIGNGAYLGANCIVGPGVTIGAGAFVGEGAVVLDDVPDHAVVYGNPARVTRQLIDGAWVGPTLPA